MVRLPRLGRIHVAAARRLARLPLRLERRRLRRAVRRAPSPDFDRPRLFYGYEARGERGRPLVGGAVKFGRLERAFPNDPQGFNVLYLGSSSPPPDVQALVGLARRRGARFVWNQDGVAYPGLGWDMRRVNPPMARSLHAADHVFFQSEFCKLSADRFLGERRGPWEVLYNAVDTSVFTPATTPPSGLVLLLGGSQYQWYRVETALRAIAALAPVRTDASLVVAGALCWTPSAVGNERQARSLARGLGIDDRVSFVGPYTQAEAPVLLRAARLLLHTKYNDPCPGTVVEAMACGLPVVYSASGGVPELVGSDAGVGVHAPVDFERDHPPEPEALAAAVIDAAGRMDELGAAARARAVERFDLGPWVERHRQVFEGLLR